MLTPHIRTGQVISPGLLRYMKISRGGFHSTVYIYIYLCNNHSSLFAVQNGKQQLGSPSGRQQGLSQLSPPGMLSYWSIVVASVSKHILVVQLSVHNGL